MKLSHNQLKYLRSLHQRKFRQKYHNFIVEGAKIATETLQYGNLFIEGIYALPGWIKENDTVLAPFWNVVTLVSEEELKRISLLTTPNQVLLIVKEPLQRFDDEYLHQHLSIYLEDIQDPGNLGTIWRICDWFGISNLFLSKNCVEAYNPKVIQASMGAFLRVKCLEIEIQELLNSFPGIKVFGAVMDGENIFNTDLRKQGLLVIGNESKGLSEEMTALLTHRVTIPRPKKGKAESLNAAVATGILCAWFNN